MSQAHESDLADQELIGSLSDRFRPVLYRYFRRRKLPARDIEDVTQEVFVRLSRRRGLAGMENISGYLFETAASVAIDYQRRANVRLNRAHEPYDDQLHAVADLGTDLVLEGKEALRLLWSGLLELPERTRNCFILARLEHMRHAEIAQRLGISVSAVEKHVVKAMAHLIERVRRPT
jgi:RNA polymerase sigma factor (sigma-70 family)